MSQNRYVPCGSGQAAEVAEATERGPVARAHRGPVHRFGQGLRVALVMALASGCASGSREPQSASSHDGFIQDGPPTPHLDGGNPEGDGGSQHNNGPTLPPAACRQPAVHDAGGSLVDVGRCGKLSYGLYANRGESEAKNRLPDFSHAGYAGGGTPLPHAATVQILSPAEGDDHARIQTAIDSVSALPVGPDGLRGAVLLTRGTYEVSDSLRITATGVTLRGEGQAPGGTVLIATQAAQHNLIEVLGRGSGLGEVEGTRRTITSEYVPVGSRSFQVTSTEGLEVGMRVGVERTPNQAWIDALGMQPFGWTPESFTIAHERVITAIDGNTVQVDVPLVDALDAQYGGGALFVADLSGRIERVGIEDLRLQSAYSDDEDEEHGWVAVQLRRTANSWVRDVTAVHFGYAAVSLESQSSFNTVQDCAMLSPKSQVTGGRRYSFNVSSGTGNLFQRCYSEQARHDFVSGGRTTGPNVWLDCYSAESSNDDGPHHRWATGLLFDNVSSLALHVENRQDSGTGHGWSGAQTMFYNSRAESVICDAPPGAMNWSIGTTGTLEEGRWAPEEPPGWIESNDAVRPRSLYLQQLSDRLGAEAVEAVTLAVQRDGRIWDQISEWAGEGNFEEWLQREDPAPDPVCERGLQSDDGLVCCLNSCGICAGEGCGVRPGGPDACCANLILDAGRSCDEFPPPCAL